MQEYEGFKDVNGNDILTLAHVDEMRDADREHRVKNAIISQRGGQTNILSSDADVSLVGGSRGGPLIISTLVWSVGISKPISDIKAGDFVIGSDGKPQKVLSHTRYNGLPCYEISFLNRKSVVASDDHRWKALIDDKWDIFETKELFLAVMSNHKVCVPDIYDGVVPVISIEYVGHRDCCCIHVSNEDQLFVIEDGIITHNSKSFSILMEALKDIENPNFRAIILRKEKADLANLIDTSKELYSDYGTYVGSDKEFIWKLNAGGSIVFSYHSGALDDFRDRFQGRQYAYIAVDEISQLDFDKFLYLLTCLRDSHGIRCRFIGSCNPPRKTHWLRQFLDYYISNEDTVCPPEFRHQYINGKFNPWFDGEKHPEMHGYPIPWRDSVKRYCFFSGAKSVADIAWGDERIEVYNKKKAQIDELWSDEYRRFGNPEDLFVMSVNFVEAKLTENLKLLEGDPQYIARLANQDKAQQMADLKGNWDNESDTEDYISESDMEAFFNRPRQLGDGVRRCSIDVAFEGGDATVMWLRVGNSFEDVAVFRLDAKNLVIAIANKLQEWGVREENVVFDSAGVGQVLIGHFKRAQKFVALEKPYGSTRAMQEQVEIEFDTIKSQSAFGFGDSIHYGEVSINPSLLEKRFTIKNGDMVRLKDILMEERLVIAIDIAKGDNGRGKCLIKKQDMKKRIGRSPDFMEAMFYSQIFFIKKQTPTMVRPVGSARYVSGNGYSGGSIVKKSHHTRGFVKYR